MCSFDGNEKLPAPNHWPIICDVIRRIHVPSLRVGDLALNEAEAHHALEVLRLPSGTVVEVFDDEGHITRAVLLVVASGVVVRVKEVPERREPSGKRFCVAAAIPKGDRIDWMIQKLSELGVYSFTPLVAARSVVIPAGKNKMERWGRLAVEAAKQSRRPGVMKIAALAKPKDLIASIQVSGRLPDPLWYLSLGAGARSIVEALKERKMPDQLTLMVGPEGGWTGEEMGMFDEIGAEAISLTATVLRVETAAVAAAAVVACWNS